MFSEGEKTVGSTVTGRVEGGTSTGTSDQDSRRVIRLNDRELAFNSDEFKTTMDSTRRGIPRVKTIKDPKVVELIARIYAVMTRRRVSIHIAVNQVLKREPPGPRGPKRRHRLKPLPSPTLSRWHGRHRARGVL